MELNPDCIRDVLLAVEKTYEGDLFFINEFNYTNYSTKYKFKEFYFHIEYCINAGLVYGKINCITSELKGLTPKGFELLDNIRNENIWYKVKETIKNISGCITAEILKTASNYVITEAIKGNINLFE